MIVEVVKELASFELSVGVMIEEGSFIAIKGRSGSGKTTLLRIIAGLEEAKGSIKVANEMWLTPKFSLPPQKRSIGFVFQEYALFENMSVLENLLFVSKDKELAHHLLEITHMQSFTKRYPKELSGGQKQRVALCRALMRRPKLLLLDEPFSALDSTTRSMLHEELKKLHQEFGMTTLMVSHDPSEIYKLADAVIEIEEGKVKAYARPKELLLKQNGSQKLAFEGKIVDLFSSDIIVVAVVAIFSQLVEVALTKDEAKGLKVGDRVVVSTKAFGATISKIVL